MNPSTADRLLPVLLYGLIVLTGLAMGVRNAVVRTVTPK